MLCLREPVNRAGRDMQPQIASKVFRPLHAAEFRAALGVFSGHVRRHQRARIEVKRYRRDSIRPHIRHDSAGVEELEDLILHHFEHVRHRRFHGGGNIAHNRPGDAQQVLNSTLGAYAHLGFGECAHLVYAKLLIFACRQILQPLKGIAAELVPLRREHWAQGLLIGLAIHPQPLAHLPRIQLLSRRRVDLGLVIDHAGVHLGLDLHIDGAFGELARAFEVEHIPNQREAHRVRHPVIGKEAGREHPVPVPRRPIDHRLVYA